MSRYDPEFIGTSMEMRGLTNKLRRLGTRDANDDSLRSDNESAVNGTLLPFTRWRLLGGTLG